ncbi:histidine kinase [Nocardioides sp. CBS4Y-1]|uniref:Histidine kinase n=1 Tax=Nocardioides acrostichi TaxID=2784339 RepID=A0A930Y8Z6_9ACTN|nr:histidine kinase [Nocardioides acrostichi]
MSRYRRPFGSPPDGEGRPWQRGGLFATVWILFLLQPLGAAWQRRDSLGGWVGLVAVLAFAAVYLRFFYAVRSGRWTARTPDSRLAATTVTLEIALGVVMCLSVGQTGTAAAVYTCVTAIMAFEGRLGIVLAGTIAVTTFAATVLVPGWSVDAGLLVAMLAASMAIWGITRMLRANAELQLATNDNQRLALSEHRNRFARDLHDVVGHSLTVIALKAELARRLVDTDRDRAIAELDDLERLSREALDDVRRAVEGYREISLTGELARARLALQAAGIETDLPEPAHLGTVPDDLAELFAWTLREGVTNVVRHSDARRCTVTVRSTSLRVADDGRGVLDVGGAGASPTSGSGLAGLSDRAAAVGAMLSTRALSPGFCLEVSRP